MADSHPQFETQDNIGSTDPYVGSVDTTGINLPSTPGADIEELSVKCAGDQAAVKRLLVSIDAGTTWFSLEPGEAMDLEPRGGIKQIKIKASGSGVTSVNYEIIMNRGEA